MTDSLPEQTPDPTEDSAEFVDLQATAASHWIDLFAATPEPPAEALDWARQMAERQQAGERLSASEQARYQQIAADFLASRAQWPAPSLEELNWVLFQEALFQQGVKPTPQTEARLWDISARFLNSQQQQLGALWESVPLPELPPSPAELQWALELLRQVQQGRGPSPEEQQRFIAILKAAWHFGSGPEHQKQT